MAEVVRLWQRLWGIPPPPGASTRPISSPASIAAALPGMPLTLAVVGDFGRCHEAGAECEAEKAVARLVASWAPDYVLTTGDNNYPAGVSATMAPNLQPYRAYIEAGRFLPALGNHDWGNRDGPRAYLAQFRPPGNGRYYHVTLGDLGLWVLDSDEHEPDGIDADSVQARWLREGLAASPTPVNVVVLHHPPYSSGAHRSSARLRWPFAAWGPTRCSPATSTATSGSRSRASLISSTVRGARRCGVSADRCPRAGCGTPPTTARSASRWAAQVPASSSGASTATKSTTSCCLTPGCSPMVSSARQHGRHTDNENG